MRSVLKWQTGSLLNRLSQSQYGFDVTVNPYRGCAHDCQYCYARDTHRYLDLNIGEDFSHKLFVKERSVAQILVELRRVPLDKVLTLGTATDPYQSLEGRYRVSRHLLEAVFESGHAVTITTKSPLIVRDVDILEKLASRQQVQVHISLISLDYQTLHAVEPGTAAPAVRLRTLATLSQRHIPTMLFAAPILPFLTDTEAQLSSLFAQARAFGALAVMASRLRLSPSMKSYFFTWLEEHYPELLARYRALYPGPSQYPDAGYSRMLGQRVTRLQHMHGLAQRLPAPRAWQSLQQPQFDFIR